MRDGRYTMGEAARALQVDAKTLRDWLAKEGIEPTADRYDARRKWLTDAQVALVAQSHDRIARQPVTLTDALERIEALEAEIAALHAPKSTHEHVTRYTGQEGGSVDGTPHVSARPQRRRSEATGDAQKLPDGLVSLVDFASLHGVPPQTCTDATKSGHVTLATGGPWPGKRNLIHRALDGQGQRQAWEHFHTRADFRACADCPHGD